MKAVLCILAILLGGCAAAGRSSGNLPAAVQGCLESAEQWTSSPKDLSRLKAAVRTVTAAQKPFEHDEATKGSRLYQDLNLLAGSLNMAQMAVEDGHDPTLATGANEPPPVDSVRMVIARLKTDLQASPPTP